MKEFPKFKVKDSEGTFYDADSVTMLEVASKLYGKMNEIITEFNALAEHVNSVIDQFNTTYKADQEAFESSMRQELQDFMDVVDMKIKGGG